MTTINGSNVNAIQPGYMNSRGVLTAQDSIIGQPSTLSQLIRVVSDPITEPVARGQAFAALDREYGGALATNRALIDSQLDQAPKADNGVMLAQAGTQPLSASPVKNSALRKFDVSPVGKALFDSNNYTMYERKNSATWYSESDPKWKDMEYVGWDKNGKPKLEDQKFKALGCHATAVLNATNATLGTNFTPLNARDAASNGNGVFGPNGLLRTKDTSGVYTKTRSDRVDIRDLSDPNRTGNNARIIKAVHNEPSITKTGINSEMIQRIKNNLAEGNVVLIGLKETKMNNVRHSVVITGIEQTKDSNGKVTAEKLMVRDNWQYAGGTSRLMSLEDFVSFYGKPGQDTLATTKWDYLWAFRAK